MVKPGGTGRPRLAISARPAPLPPSRSRMSARPSALPLPKRYTHFALLGVGARLPDAGGLRGAAALRAGAGRTGFFGERVLRDDDLAMQLPTRMCPASAIAVTEAAASAEEVIDAVEPGEADDDQVDRHDEVQQARHDQDQDAGDQGDQRRDVGDGQSHGDLLGPGESTTERNRGSKKSGRGH